MLVLVQWVILVTSRKEKKQDMERIPAERDVFIAKYNPSKILSM